MQKGKVTVAVNIIQGKIATILGYCVAVFAILALIGVGTEAAEKGNTDSAVLIVAIVIFILGVLSILKGIQIKRRIKRFKKYVSLISVQNMTSVNDLAVNTEKSVDFVIKDLKKMIEKKFFANAVINLQTNKIIITADPNQPGQTRNAVCEYCGAIGRVTDGKINECEYCGSILK